MIENPNYKGPWIHPEIDNPDFVADDKLYVHENLAYVGFELWQVKSGSIFDNVLITDDAEYAKQFAVDTWGAMKDAEKTAFDLHQEAESEKMRAEAERLEAEREAEAEASKDDADEEEDEEG